jgi:hypothetical protein
MKSFASRMVLACLLVFTPTLAAFAQQTSKDVFNPGMNAQNALTNVSRGHARQKKGDLNRAMADYDQANSSAPRPTTTSDKATATAYPL